MQRCHVAVIGGGIAGAAAAYFLSPNTRVVLLERESSCGRHATGRSASLFTESYGGDLVRRLAIAGRAFLERPPDGYGAAPLLSSRPLLFVGRADQTDALDRIHSAASSLVPSVRRLTGAEVEHLVPALRPGYAAGGVLEPDAMDLDVAALLQGYLAGARHNGAEVLTGAGVAGLERGGRSWRIRAGDREIEAEFVVDAAGAWADRVAEMAGAAPLGLRPLRRTAFTFVPPPDPEHRRRPMVVDADEDFYFKPEGPLYLASPADETPSEPMDARPAEIDVARAIARIERATTFTIRHVHHAWAGLRSFLPDRLPVAGFDPVLPGFFWLAGQGGYGIKTSPAMGMATAALIAGQGLPGPLQAAGITPEHLAPQRLGRTAPPAS